MTSCVRPGGQSDYDAPVVGRGPPLRSRTRRTAARPIKPPRWAFLAIATHVNGFRKLIHVDKKLPLGLEENKRSNLISMFPIMFYISCLLFFFSRVTRSTMGGESNC